jgi:hypothetical protein
MEDKDVRSIKTEWMSVLAVLLIQTATGIWWASDVTSRVEFLEKQQSKGERFTYSDGLVMEAKISHINRTLERHMQRTEGRIEEIHSAVINKMSEHNH